MILKDCLTNSAARNRVEIGCILSKDCNLSSAVCACNSCHILQGPGVKQADLNYMNEPSVTLRPQQDKEERSLAASKSDCKGVALLSLTFEITFSFETVVSA